MVDKKGLLVVSQQRWRQIFSANFLYSFIRMTLKNSFFQKSKIKFLISQLKNLLHMPVAQNRMVEGLAELNRQPGSFGFE